MIDYYSEFGEQKFVPLAHAMNVANDGGHQDISGMSASLASYIDETVKGGPKLLESSMFPNLESVKVDNQYPMASASESYISLPTSTITNPSLYSFSNPSQSNVKHPQHKSTYQPTTSHRYSNMGENNSPNSYNLNPLSPQNNYYDSTFTSPSQMFDGNEISPYDNYNCYSPIQGPYILSPPNSSPEMTKSSQWGSPISQNNIITTQCNQVPSYNKHPSDWNSLGEPLSIDTSPYVPFPFSIPSPESKSPVTNDMARVNILDIDVCHDNHHDKSPFIEVDIGHFLPKAKEIIDSHGMNKDGLKKRTKRGRPKGSKSVKNKNSMLSLLGQPLPSECKRTKVSKPRDMNPGIKARARSKSSLEELMQHIPQLFDKEAVFNKRGLR